MALVAWALVWELLAVYGLAWLRSPADAGLLFAWGILGLAAGWYGLAGGRYWQRIAWLAGLVWYVSQLARYVGVVDPIAAAMPEGSALAMLLGLLYLVMLPIAWMLSLAAMAIAHVGWSMDDGE